MTTIDLRLCKPGDKLEARDGEVWTYQDKSDHTSFTHALINPSTFIGFFKDNGGYCSSRQAPFDIVKVHTMTTQPKQIPPRGTKEFTQYAIGVMEAHDRGERIECASRGKDNYDYIKTPEWDWRLDYRIAPTPIPIPKTRRYETSEEFMALIPTHGIFAVRRKSDGGVSTAYIVVGRGESYIHVFAFSNIEWSNFRDYEKSLDGGKTWVDCGVEE